MDLTLKYRPKTFDDVVGQSFITNVLKRQIETNTFKNTYLFCGSFGTGKTTCARILANEINKGKGTPIEIDGASHNGVDDIRALIEDANTSAIDAEYKFYIIDECMTGDVEILTDKGFVRLDSLNHTENVAQYTNEGHIEFVKPIEYICKHYEGNLDVWNPRYNRPVRMTPHHVQPLYYAKSRQIKEKYIKDIHFGQQNYLIMSGNGTFDDGGKLSDIDKVAIMSQADGTLQSAYADYNYWTIQLKKETKILRCIELLKNAGIPWTEIKSCREGYRRFSYKTPISVTKQLATHFTIPHSAEYAQDFIKEISMWDGWNYGESNIGYDSIIKNNVDLVCAVASQGGYSCMITHKVDNRSDKFSDIYRLQMTKSTMRNCAYMKKTHVTEKYSGEVYCVKVPSQKIVVRSNGVVFITGNCHMLTTQAWNAALKLIEDPPTHCIFAFCTTNPEKLPSTILSRVQRFDFKKINNSDIVERLIYILNAEQIAIYDKNALNKIAILSDGHMRDAVKMLDTCLNVNKNVSVELVESVFGLVKQDSVNKIIKALLTKNLNDCISEYEHCKERDYDGIKLYDAILSTVLDAVLKGRLDIKPLMNMLYENRKILNRDNADGVIKYIIAENCV